MNKELTLALKFRKKLEALKKKQYALVAQIARLQEECPHFNLRYRYRGNSGGWDYDPSYWTDWYCPDCTKRWTTSQERKDVDPILKASPNAIKVDYYSDRERYNDFYNDALFPIVVSMPGKIGKIHIKKVLA